MFVALDRFNEKADATEEDFKPVEKCVLVMRLI